MKIADEIIDQLEAYLMMRESKGKIFSIRFTKKDGTIRRMVCRLGVKKGVNGKGMKYTPIEKRLICVYDMGKHGYRMINLKTIDMIKINGIENKVISFN